MSSPTNIQILFPSPLFPAAQSNLFQCSWVSWINTHQGQRISTSLHMLHPQCPRLTSFPTVKDSISHHILARRNYLLYKKLRHYKCSLWQWDHERGLTLSEVQLLKREKDEIYERAGWLKAHLVVLGIRSLYLASIPLFLYTANWCCYSSSLEQRGRNLN